MGILDFNLSNTFDEELLPDNTPLEMRIERAEAKLSAKTQRPLVMVIFTDPTNDRAADVIENFCFPIPSDSPKQANRFLLAFKNCCEAFDVSLTEVTDESLTALVGQRGWVTLKTEKDDRGRDVQRIASFIKNR